MSADFNVLYKSSNFEAYLGPQMVMLKREQQNKLNDVVSTRHLAIFALLRKQSVSAQIFIVQNVNFYLNISPPI